MFVYVEALLCPRHYTGHVTVTELPALEVLTFCPQRSAPVWICQAGCLITPLVPWFQGETIPLLAIWDPKPLPLEILEHGYS